MIDYDLTELNRRYRRTEPHGDCGRLCPCSRRGKLEEKEAEQARRWEREAEHARLWQEEVAEREAERREETVSIVRVCVTLLLVIGAAVWVAKNCVVWN